MLAAVFTWEGVVKGVVNGAEIALVAMGLVLVYRSSRVINFAAGAIGLPATALLGYMVAAQGFPYWPSLIVVMLVGALTGTIIELAVFRRLSKSPRVILFVATIGVAELCQAIYTYVPGYKTGTAATQFPVPFTGTFHPRADTLITANQILIVAVVAVVAAVLWWLLGHTAFGDDVQAAATNADLARMTGISPKLLTTCVWSIAGLLSALGLILTATDTGSADLSAIGPGTLMLALAAALMGRMQSFPAAVAGALGIGLAEQTVYQNFPNDTGVVQFVVFLLVLVLVARHSRDGDTGGESFQFAPRVTSVPERLRDIWWVRRMPQGVALVALAAAILLPLTTRSSERHLLWATILGFALCAVSAVILTGWAGQLSLGQMAFAGIGALTAATFARGMRANIGWHSLRIINGRLQPVSFPWTILLGALMASAAAALVGIGALRVRGLLLAASTIAFAIACEVYLFHRPFFTGGESTVSIPRVDIGPLELTHRNRAYYYFALIVLCVVLVIVARIRRSGIGRIIIGVRENENAASAMTVSPTRAKLIAFALGGFVAGLGGGILGAVNTSFGPAQRFFLVGDSLALVAMAVIGGLGSLSGAVLGALWVVGLPSFWPDNPVIPLFTSSIGLLIILLYFPGGFTQVGYYTRDSLLRWLERRLPPAPVKAATEPPAAIARLTPGTPPTNSDGSVLRTRDLTVRYGGNVALFDVNIAAQTGEIVGLIGTNGAGKSTLLNAIGGYAASTGRVELLGQDISHMRPHRRARIGLGRTFQAATLFPELTVRQTVELALEARKRTGFWASALFLPNSGALARRRRTEASELIDFLGLGRYADRFIAELSTGTRRIVELTAMLAVQPRVICLDEPTAGVAQREAEAFGPLIRRIQKELDATILIVEHDMPMIMSISDRMYCLESGAVIAHGTPSQMRSDPIVIASYLGTDERAIARSNT